ncbi:MULTISPECIES: glycosyltransferase family 2 protein [Clostridium]|uniref:Glycosyltransferase family 2 protein n=1 Tax=Clostridium cibarium TaxID=2762247 RepID=A0ABR8PNU0_9CLOT|nr:MULTISPECIES: glycosyltransferase family 2 protein [Clostridium]MBD7909851.1 glycosyltransferase family 2 protein [Clostridium cibarium]
MNLKEIKEAIGQKIISEEYNEARTLIDYYKSNLGSDDEILGTEAVLYIYTSDLERSMECVRAGLKYNMFNSDLYCTMGNIYELKGEYNRAYICYEQALFLCSELENKKVISGNITNLKENYNIEVKKASIIILTYNNLEYTQICVKSIKQYNSSDSYELLVVDNNSSDDTPNWLNEQSDIKCILNKENKGFPAGCNQGIMIAEKENDIFLLNNDTVIMPNSIFNLRLALYSNENIGATGSVSNSISYYQQISNQYGTFDEYMDYALQNNIPNDEEYEQRLKLVGFAMLIKRKVLDKIGLLDERFTPGNFEDDDISLRIVMEGYKLLLCRDSYIHHFGSVSFKKDADKYIKLLNTNEKKFEEKWGFSTRYNLIIDYNLSQFITDNDSKIIEVFCRTGSSIASLSSIYRKASFYGYEIEESLKKIASKSIKVIDNLSDKGLVNTFDIIVVSNYDGVKNDGAILTDIFNMMKNENGKLILSIDNFQCSSGKITTEIIDEAIRIFKSKNFKYIDGFEAKDEIGNLAKVYMVFEKYSEDEIIYNIEYFMEEGKIAQAEFNVKRLEYYSLNLEYEEKYRILKNKLDTYKELSALLRRIDFKSDNELSNEKIVAIIDKAEISEKVVVNLIEDLVLNKNYVLNLVALNLFYKEKYDLVLPFLQKAYELNEEDEDTLYNLAYVLNLFGEKEIALTYALKIRIKNDDVLQLIDEISGGE